jgi:hypothetical protein
MKRIDVTLSLVLANGEAPDTNELKWMLLDALHEYQGHRRCVSHCAAVEVMAEEYVNGRYSEWSDRMKAGKVETTVKRIHLARAAHCAVHSMETTVSEELCDCGVPAETGLCRDCSEQECY